MTETVFVLKVWCFYLIPAIILSAPLWFFGRRKVDWNIWNFSVLIFPYWIWVALLFVADDNTTIHGLLVVAVFGAVVSLSSVVRVIVGHRLNQKLLAAGLCTFFSLIAVAIWFSNVTRR